MNAKKIVEDVFTKNIAELIWTSNTYMVFPVTPQNFSIGAVLPAVLYMFRWGQRRGRGRFHDVFSPKGETYPSIASVSGTLAGDGVDFVNFRDGVKQGILGDLLLCFALENIGHEEGHNAEVQRAFPTHYMASWLDLPYTVANLRFVPEMLVALLSAQPSGKVLASGASKMPFALARGLDSNRLLKIFGKGVSIEGFQANARADKIDESEDFSIDQLLTIRLAQKCGEAPDTMRGGLANIPNSWSVARAAALRFRDDLAIFLQAYGTTIPRLSLVPMLESLIGLGLLNLFLSCMNSAIHWYNTGALLSDDALQPWPIFADASSSSDYALRRISEESMERVSQLIDQAQAALMCVRIMDAKGRFDQKLKTLAPQGPDASDWLNILGAVRFEKHERSGAILNNLSELTESLAVALEREAMHGDLIEGLRSESNDPASKLAETISSLMDEKIQRKKYMQFLDDSLMIDSPHGLGRKRRVNLRTKVKGRSTTDVRSLVLSNTLLDALAHRHICPDGETCMQKPLAFSAFLDILRTRYGFYIDQSPPGMSISNEDLRRNRQILERRLRDLGLLVGVNDAESMKRLHPRFLADKGVHPA